MSPTIIMRRPGLTRVHLWFALLALLIGSAVAYGVWLAWRVVPPLVDMQSGYIRLLQQGDPMRGEVIRIEPTSAFINNQPVVRVTVGYRQDDQERRAVFEQVLPYTVVPRVQPGMLVPLRVDMRNNDAVVIDLQRLDMQGK
jgi:hypothetical protein